MIPIKERPEPLNFEEKVRKPGRVFLEKTPSPKSTEWKDSWRNALDDLYDEYEGICAYSAQWFDRSLDGSVDHFIPKSNNPGLAYEWSNFRLSTKTLNGNKGVSLDTLDPFTIKPNWFVLKFSSLFIQSGPDVTPLLKEKIKRTIDILKLNGRLKKRREDWLRGYCEEDFTFDYLKKRAPFIAFELQRQNLVPIKEINAIMKFAKQKK